MVTLTTKDLGRGTDFFIRDEKVIANGGLCTIQTFLSVDESEEA
jgi:preprotein translocase subunit SecA